MQNTGKGNKKAPVKTQTPDAPQSSKTTRLSYNQQRLLDILPQTAAKLEAEIAEIEQKLGDADLYIRNREEFDRFSQSLVQKQKELEDTENRWLEIQMLKEELETAN